MVKLNDRCFCCFTAAMLVPLRRAPTWRFHTKLYKFGWSTFPNDARMKNRTELNLGKVFYVWLIYHIQDFWLNLLNGYDIYFWLRDTANQPYLERCCFSCIWCLHPPGGYSIYPCVGRCGAAPHTLTLFKTNIADFPTLFKTEFRLLIPCFRHLTWILINKSL